MSEVLSQSLILLMLLCVVSFRRTSPVSTLGIFSPLASFCSVVHFANVPIWEMLGLAICMYLLPVGTRHGSDVRVGSSLGRLRSLRFDRAKMPAFAGALFVALVVPLLVTISYWIADPGVRRYVRLSKKMVTTSGRVDQLVESFVVRLENLSLFVHPLLWIGVAVCLALFVSNRGVELSQIATHSVWMRHPNQVGPTEYPRISDGAHLNFYLYQLQRR
jgi:hypothetical protein